MLAFSLTGCGSDGEENSSSSSLSSSIASSSQSNSSAQSSLSSSSSVESSSESSVSSTTTSSASSSLPDATPLQKVKMEAEDFSKAGDASAIFESGASGEYVLANVNQIGSGFTFVAPQKTKKSRFYYRADTDVRFSVMVNNEAKAESLFVATASLTDFLSMDINELLNEGDSISLAFVSGGSLTLDYVDLIPNYFEEVGTLAKAAAFNGDGLTIDKDGNIFAGTSKGATVKRVTPSGEISLFASFNGGSANGSDFDSQGNLYVANESNNIIQKITPEGIVSDYVTDIVGPAGIYIDEQDNLIVGMYGQSAANPGAEVLKITPDKTITTLASGGGLTNVVGVAGDGLGRYFAANFLTGEVFEVTGGNIVQIGAAGTRVNHIKYADGFIYMPNPFDNVVRRMDLNGNVELIAGTKSVAGSVDGPSLQAKFSRPNSIDISADGKTLYILDFNTGDVRTISMGE